MNLAVVSVVAFGFTSCHRTPRLRSFAPHATRDPVAPDVAIKLQYALLLSAPCAALLAVHLGVDPATGPLFPRSGAASY
jgi:hypothetical protein